MAWQSNHPLFRSLTNEEEQQFREHARIEPPEDLSKWRIYHPVCRAEWVKRGITPMDFDPGREFLALHGVFEGDQAQ